MAFHLSERSKQRLVGVHPDLIKVVHRAIELSAVDFAVICGLRTLHEQKILVDLGKSTTMKSRHLTGHAVDLAAIVDGKANWMSVPYYKINSAMNAAAFENGVKIEWGGDFVSFKDFDHWQLSKKDYPAMR